MVVQRRRWWPVIAVVVVLGAAAVVASLLTGTDPLDDAAADEAAPPDEAAAEASDAAPSPDEGLPGEASTDLGAPAEPDAGAAGDESAAGETETEAESQRLFGEPEHPISGVEPYIPSRVRPVELGPPAEVCTGTLAATRIQLPLRFASTKPERIEQLTWSPDCRRVVFRMDATLWLADGDGTGDMPFLTAQGGLSAPAWSPDSQWIAFSQGAIAEGERVSHIFMVLPDGLGLAQITHGLVLDQEPAWSPDESQIAFARRVRVTDADGGVRFEHRIVVVDLLDGQEQVVSASVERSSAPSWSPDGGAIAFRVGDELRAVRLDDLAHSTLLTEVVGGRGSWSPDSSRVAAWRDWSADSATIVISDLPGQYPGDQHVITLGGLEQASPAMAPTLQWSADGQRLFFFRSDSPNSHWAYSLVVPRPTRSPAYWEMLDVVETVAQEAGYEVVAVQHSVDVEAEFSVRGNAGQTTVEVRIAFGRSDPRGVYDAIENPHSEVSGILRSPDRIGVWFGCDNLYGEVLAPSLQTADALAAALIPAACPAT